MDTNLKLLKNGIQSFDLTNGAGVRTSIWFAGCSHKCEDCFSPSSWNWNKGIDWKLSDVKSKISNDVDRYDIDGISILGGDPLYLKNLEVLKQLLLWFKLTYPQKTIWLWTGYTLEQIKENNKFCFILDHIDVLIDGRFEKDKKNLDLSFRGSSNQRIIKIKEINNERQN